MPGGAHEDLGELAVTRPADAADTIAVHEEAFQRRGLRRRMAPRDRPGGAARRGVRPPQGRRLRAGQGARAVGLHRDACRASSTRRTPPTTRRRRRSRQLVRDHFAILKVGPGATFALRETLWGLAEIEREWLGEGAGGGFKQQVLGAMREQPGPLAEVLRRAGAARARPAVQPQRPHPLLLDDARRGAGRASAWSPPRGAAQPVPLTLLSQYLPRLYDGVRAGDGAPTTSRRCCARAWPTCCATTRRPATRRARRTAARRWKPPRKWHEESLRDRSVRILRRRRGSGRRARSRSSRPCGKRRWRRLAGSDLAAWIAAARWPTRACASCSPAPAPRPTSATAWRRVVSRRWGRTVEAVPTTDLVGRAALRVPGRRAHAAGVVRALGQQPRERRRRRHSPTQCCRDCRHLVITCNADGRAVRAAAGRIRRAPGWCCRTRPTTARFAMTSSFTSMLLAAARLFGVLEAARRRARRRRRASARGAAVARELVDAGLRAHRLPGRQRPARPRARGRAEDAGAHRRPGGGDARDAAGLSPRPQDHRQRRHAGRDVHLQRPAGARLRPRPAARAARATPARAACSPSPRSRATATRAVDLVVDGLADADEFARSRPFVAFAQLLALRRSASLRLTPDQPIALGHRQPRGAGRGDPPPRGGELTCSWASMGAAPRPRSCWPTRRAACWPRTPRARCTTRRWAWTACWPRCAGAPRPVARAAGAARAVAARGWACPRSARTAACRRAWRRCPPQAFPGIAVGRGNDLECSHAGALGGADGISLVAGTGSMTWGTLAGPLGALRRLGRGVRRRGLGLLDRPRGPGAVLAHERRPRRARHRCTTSSARRAGPVEPTSTCRGGGERRGAQRLRGVCDCGARGGARPATSTRTRS